jgi:hypothetical protein
MCVCSVRLVAGEDGSVSAEWTGHSRWMEVTIGLVGDAGRMTGTGPTLKLPSLHEVRIVKFPILHVVM